MEPTTTLIVTALALGAARGLAPTAEQAVRDAYQGLKQVIIDRYKALADGVEYLEKKPDAKTRQDAMAEEIEEIGAELDLTVLEKARELHERLKELAPDMYQVHGVKIKDIEVAANARIKGIRSSGTGVKIEGGKFGGNLDIGDMLAGIDPNA